MLNLSLPNYEEEASVTLIFFARLIFQKEEVEKENHFRLTVLSKFYQCSFVRDKKEEEMKNF